MWNNLSKYDDASRFKWTWNKVLKMKVFPNGVLDIFKVSSDCSIKYFEFYNTLIVPNQNNGETDKA